MKFCCLDGNRRLPKSVSHLFGIRFFGFEVEYRDVIDSQLTASKHVSSDY